MLFLGALTWRITGWVKQGDHLREVYTTSELIRFSRNIEIVNNNDSKVIPFLYVNNENSPLLNKKDTYYAIKINYQVIFYSLDIEAVKKVDDKYVYLTGSHKNQVLIPNENISIVDLSQPKGEVFIKNPTSLRKDDIEKELNNTDRWYDVFIEMSSFSTEDSPSDRFI